MDDPVMLTVVTGATGHIGPNLVRALLENHRTVRAVALGPKEPMLAHLDVEYLDLDVRDEEQLEKAFHGADVVYHLAAYISVTEAQRDKLFDVNVNGVESILRAALRANIRRLVHFSSVHALQQKPLDVPLDETRALADKDGFAYDRSKALGHRAVLEAARHGLDVVIVLPSGVLGPCDYAPSRMGGFLVKLFQGRLRTMIAGGFDWVDVRDVVQGAMAAEKRGRTGESYILSGHYQSIADLVHMACKISEVRAPWITWPLWLGRIGIPWAWGVGKLRGAEPLLTPEALNVLQSNRRMLHAKAYREWGYQPRPLETTLRDTYTWFQEQGYVPQNGRAQ